MRKRILFLCGLVALLAACKKTKKVESDDANTSTTPTEVVLTTEQIKSIIDSNMAVVDIQWDSVIVADDRKMADIKRLLDEVSYNDAADEKRLKELYKLFEKVQNTRYTQENLTGELIDAYDAAQDELITATNALAESTPNIEAYPLAIELMNDIVEADGMTFSRRGDYDRYAKRINRILKKYPEKVQELGAPYSQMNRIGIFGFDD